MSPIFIIYSIIAIFTAVVFHEVSHGYAAYKLGDSTARDMGRLTLNPIAHIDLFGTIILPAILIIMGATPIGWAKPVPVNFNNLHNPKRDTIIVSLAGVGVNFIIAAVSVMLIKIFYILNISLLKDLFEVIAFVNILIAVFNLIPIPPLDGSRVVLMLLPARYAYYYARGEIYGFFIVLLLVWLGFFRIIILPIALFIFNLLLKLVGF